MLKFNFLEKEFFNNTIQDYLLFIFIFVGLFIVFRIFRLIVLSKLKQFFKKTQTDIDDFIIQSISEIPKYIFWFLSFYFSINFLKINEKFIYIFDKIFIIVIIYEIIIFIEKGINFAIDKISSKKDKTSKAAYSAIGKSLIWITWLAGLLFLISNFGVNITALATGLGIGGIAIAFALQGILKDLFSYFTILLDKPVRVGDYINIDGKKGKVKEIGLKTTRLKSVDGQEIVIANELITSTSLDNHGKAKFRRVNVQYGVSYDTDVKTLKILKKEIQKIIESFDKVEFRRCHLRHLSASSMDYDIVYHIDTRDYILYMDINEQINFKILELFEKKKVEIPYPSQTIYTRKG